MNQNTFSDPWLLLTAFGLVASAGLLVYLVKQLNAAPDDEDELAVETAAVEPPPAAPSGGSKEESSAADAISMAMGGSVAQPKAEEAPKPAPVRPDISPAVAFIKALHEDIQTFHWEIQSMKKKLDKFEENQEKLIAEIAAKLDKMQPPPPPATPFQ